MLKGKKFSLLGSIRFFVLACTMLLVSATTAHAALVDFDFRFVGDLFGLGTIYHVSATYITWNDNVETITVVESFHYELKDGSTIIDEFSVETESWIHCEEESPGYECPADV